MLNAVNSLLDQLEATTADGFVNVVMGTPSGSATKFKYVPFAYGDEPSSSTSSVGDCDALWRCISGSGSSPAAARTRCTNSNASRFARSMRAQVRNPN